MVPSAIGGFVVYGDTSKHGLRCVLMQNGKIIAYACRQLKDYEKNYSIHDLELATIIFAFKIGARFIPFTKV